MRNNRRELGTPGTAKHRRMWRLKGITQRELASRCIPPTSQAAIDQFESASVALTWRHAERLAPGYFPELWDAGTNGLEPRDKAVQAVWRLWIATARAYGSEEIKSLAGQIESALGDANGTQIETGLGREGNGALETHVRPERHFAGEARTEVQAAHAAGGH